jgi:lipopolysaccharide transport system ATP-binding protein
MKPAICVQGIGKRYRIGAKERAHRTLREAVVDLAAEPIRRLGRIRQSPGPEELIWALRNVTFEVQPGEVVGVIGRNGAGKSTLLKILSRITEPTEGRVELRGRVASLLEVGTGFHPELTGRENIYLNGTILGMKKAEIDRKFDEIVAFSEIEKFLDTPVKHYSSGMYVRLAFAVAAHLDPEILLVDEVLAVGDAAFQKKCLGKMGEAAKSGRTVLFVSHNISAIKKLTERSLYLEHGAVAADGRTDEVVQKYLTTALQRTENGGDDLEFYRRGRDVDSPIRLLSIWTGDSKNSIAVIPFCENFTIRMVVECSRPVRGANLAINICGQDGDIVSTLLAWDSDFKLHLSPGSWIISCAVHGLRLMPGLYLLDVGVNQSPMTKAWDVIVQRPSFRVANLAGRQLMYRPDRPGSVFCDHVDWHVHEA